VGKECRDVTTQRNQEIGGQKGKKDRKTGKGREETTNKEGKKQK
jgi:hypothetical protein